MHNITHARNVYAYIFDLRKVWTFGSPSLDLARDGGDDLT